MDKNSPSKEMSLAFPVSAGALYQFLSSQTTERGLKIKNPYTTKPVLTVREKPQPLSQKQRDAWAFHLKEIHQRQAGTNEAENAAALIESFLKADAAKATAGTLLGPVAALMKAEQVCIQKSSSVVRRWMANEQKVQEIATSTGENDGSAMQALQYKNALTLARQILGKFPDVQHGEINVELIRDSAYTLGSLLSKEDIQLLHKALFIVVKRSQELTDYIGPEVPLLMNLCMLAKGVSVEEYRAAYETKDLCSKVAAVLRARTDNEEYIVPASPRNLKASVPSVTGYPATIVQTGNGSRMPAPSSRTVSSVSSQATDTDMSLHTSPVANRSLPRSVTEGTSAALVVELKGQQRQQLTHSATVAGGASPQQAGDYSPYRPLQARQPSDPTEDKAAVTKRTGHARSASSTVTLTEEPVRRSNQEKRKLRRSMQYEAPPLEGADHDRKARHTEAGRDSTKKPDREFKEKRKEQKAQRLSQPVGQELKALQQQPVPALKSERKIPADVSATLDAIFAARGDNTFDEKWNALQSRLGSQLHAEGRAVVNKMLPYWKGVNLNKLDKTIYSSMVLAAGMSRKDRIALIDVRDALLADSLRSPQAVASAVFPELLVLVIHSIDAQRNLPQVKS